MSLVLCSAIAAMPPEPKTSNLKVLPKKLSHEQVEKIMRNWSQALGVRCNFCHVRNAETNRMDFASDAKIEKEMARRMFKMTGKINSKFFKAKKDSLGLIMQTGVSCVTCHNGKTHPAGGMDVKDTKAK